MIFSCVKTHTFESISKIQANIGFFQSKLNIYYSKINDFKMQIESIFLIMICFEKDFTF